MGLASFNRMRREQEAKVEETPSLEVSPKILKLIENIDSQKEKGLKILAEHFGIEFVSVEETLPLIKAEIEKGK